MNKMRFRYFWYCLNCCKFDEYQIRWNSLQALRSSAGFVTRRLQVYRQRDRGHAEAWLSLNCEIPQLCARDTTILCCWGKSLLSETNCPDILACLFIQQTYTRPLGFNSSRNCRLLVLSCQKHRFNNPRGVNGRVL